MSPAFDHLDPVRWAQVLPYRQVGARGRFSHRIDFCAKLDFPVSESNLFPLPQLCENHRKAMSRGSSVGW